MIELKWDDEDLIDKEFVCKSCGKTVAYKILNPERLSMIYDLFTKIEDCRECGKKL